MAGIGKFKLTDALNHPQPAVEDGKRGKPKPTHETAPEQVREAHEGADAKNAEGSIRDRMVSIGRGNQQAGRQGQ